MEEYTLQVALETGKRTVLQGSMDVLLVNIRGNGIIASLIFLQLLLAKVNGSPMPIAATKS